MVDDIPPISTPTPFKIDFEEEQVNDLRRRLSNARFGEDILPDEKNAGPAVLPRVSMLKEWVEEWKQMDFKQFENELNKFEHFKTKIDWCGE